MITKESQDVSGIVRPLRIPTSTVGATIQERFEAFHAQNPWILAALEQLAAEYLRTTRGRRIGIRMLWEQIRWQYDRIVIDPTSVFKVNDHYHSRYVRLLLTLHPEWAGCFQTRALRTP